MKKTLIALTVAASAMTAGSVAAADWVSGDFNTSIDFGGVISQPVKGGWAWMTPEEATATVSKMDVKADAGLVDDGQSKWSNIGDKNILLLAGKTLENSVTGAGMLPVISFGGEGFVMEKPAGDANIITLTAKGKSDSSKVGSFTFKLNTYMLSAAKFTQAPGAMEGARDVLQLVTAPNNSAWGNGYASNGSNQKAIMGDEGYSLVQAAMGEYFPFDSKDGYESIGTGRPSLFNGTNPSANGVTGAPVKGGYAAEFVKNSGTLIFPADAIPQDWEAKMTATVSYM